SAISNRRERTGFVDGIDTDCTKPRRSSGSGEGCRGVPRLFADGAAVAAFSAAQAGHVRVRGAHHLVRGRHFFAVSRAVFGDALQPAEVLPPADENPLL